MPSLLNRFCHMLSTLGKAGAPAHSDTRTGTSWEEHEGYWEPPVPHTLALPPTPETSRPFWKKGEEATVMSQCPCFLPSLRASFPFHTQMCSQELNKGSDDRNDDCSSQMEWRTWSKNVPKQLRQIIFHLTIFKDPITNIFYNKWKGPSLRNSHIVVKAGEAVISGNTQGTPPLAQPSPAQPCS